MKTVIVTGAMGGIGSACVDRLIQSEWNVVGFDIVAEDKANRKNSENFLYLCGDLSDVSDRERLIAETVRAFGRLDALVNVAGVAPTERNDILDMTEQSYDRVMNINTKATLFLTQLAAKEMIRERRDNMSNGYIVNISSMSAYTSSVSRGEYCISKAGVSMITKLFADRLASENIVVNEIRPGIIMTGMTEPVKKKYDRLIDGGLLPIARWGQPEDIAKMVEIMCSDGFAYTTGQSVDVDGGFHIQRL